MNKNVKKVPQICIPVNVRTIPGENVGGSFFNIYNTVNLVFTSGNINAYKSYAHYRWNYPEDIDLMDYYSWQNNPPNIFCS